MAAPRRAGAAAGGPKIPDAPTFLRGVARATAAPCYLLLGDEPFFKQRVVDALRRRLLGADAPASAVETRSGMRQAGEAPLSAAALLDDLRTPSLFAAVRLVRVTEARPLVDAGGDALLAYVRQPAPGAHLVLECESVDRRTRLGKALAEAAVAVDCRRPFDHPPPWQGDAAPWDHPLAAWLVTEARTHGLVLDKPVAHLLTQRVGGEPGLLARECERLAAVLGATPDAPKPLREADCEALVPDTRGEDLFRFGDALARRDAAALWKVLDALFRDGIPDRDGSRTRDEGGVAVRTLAWVHRTLRELWVARDLRRPDDVAARLKKQPVFAEQLCRQARAWAEFEFAALWPRLRDADVALKSGAEQRLTLEALLAALLPARSGA